MSPVHVRLLTPPSARQAPSERATIAPAFTAAPSIMTESTMEVFGWIVAEGETAAK